MKYKITLVINIDEIFDKKGTETLLGDFHFYEFALEHHAQITLDDFLDYEAVATDGDIRASLVLDSCVYDMKEFLCDKDSVVKILDAFEVLAVKFGFSYTYKVFSDGRIVTNSEASYKRMSKDLPSDGVLNDGSVLKVEYDTSGTYGNHDSLPQYDGGGGRVSHSDSAEGDPPRFCESA